MARARFAEAPSVLLKLNGSEARFLKALLGELTAGQLNLLLERNRLDLLDELRHCQETYHPRHTIWEALTKLDISEPRDA